MRGFRITGAQFKRAMRAPMPKKWGWDIYYWPHHDQVFIGREFTGLVRLMENPRLFCVWLTPSRMPKTLVKVGEL